MISRLDSFEDALMFFIKEDKADLVRLVEAVEGKVENAEKISKIKEML